MGKKAEAPSLTIEHKKLAMYLRVAAVRYLNIQRFRDEHGIEVPEEQRTANAHHITECEAWADYLDPEGAEEHAKWKQKYAKLRSRHLA